MKSCEKCGEPVVIAGDVILDPRPRCFVVSHRSTNTEVDAWHTTEAMVEHASVCRARSVGEGIVRAETGKVVPGAAEPGATVCLDDDVREEGLLAMREATRQIIPPKWVIGP